MFLPRLTDSDRLSHLPLQLTADQDIDNYWVWAVPNFGTVTTDGAVNSAILRYSGADEVEPDAANLTSTIPLAETDLVPLENLAAPGDAVQGGVDYALNLDFAFVRLTQRLHPSILCR